MKPIPFCSLLPSSAWHLRRAISVFAAFAMSLPIAASALEAGQTTPELTTSPDVKVLTTRAEQASSQQRYAEAAALYEALSRVANIATQDDVMPLLSAAQNYAQAGQHEQAIALWKRVMTIPAAPGAHPPGMMPPPFDYRGEARWGMAQSRRAQGRWSEALELYRLNRATYPRDDGCVRSGMAFQQMAMAEGACLENLGRYREAVELYWPAAMSLGGNVSPLAMRRLVDFYAAAGQSAVLEAAVARETTAFPVYFGVLISGRADTELKPEQEKLVEHEMLYSSLPAFERVRHFRKAARERRWEMLLSALQFKPDTRNETALDQQIPAWRRREAISSLALVAKEAVPILERALEADAKNPYLQAALLFCRASEEQPFALIQNTDVKNWEINQTLQDVIGFEPTPWRFPTPPPTLRLPTQLPLFFKTAA